MPYNCSSLINVERDCQLPENTQPLTYSCSQIIYILIQFNPIENALGVSYTLYGVLASIVKEGSESVLSETDKILKGINRGYVEKIFSIVDVSRTRRHSLRIRGCP